MKEMSLNLKSQPHPPHKSEQQHHHHQPLVLLGVQLIVPVCVWCWCGFSRFALWCWVRISIELRTVWASDTSDRVIRASIMHASYPTPSKKTHFSSRPLQCKRGCLYARLVLSCLVHPWSSVIKTSPRCGRFLSFNPGHSASSLPPCCTQQHHTKKRAHRLPPQQYHLARGMRLWLLAGL